MAKQLLGKMKKINKATLLQLTILLAVLIFILIPNIPNVKALNYTSFNNNLSYENLTSSSYLCYQETATTATSCGGLSTGTYTVLGENPVANYGTLYINYTKPLNAINGTIWQVKHGNSSQAIAYNVSIESTCFSETGTTLQLRFVSSNCGDFQSFSFGQCYNSSTWINITKNQNNTISCGGDSPASSALMYDGDWGLGSNAGYNLGNWKKSFNFMSDKIYEEAIIWNISNYTRHLEVNRYNRFINTTFNATINISAYPSYLVSNTTNATLEIGTPDGNYEWNYTEFNSTYSPQTTLDFSAKLNSIVPACSCSGCNLFGDMCLIPFLFDSNVSGILQYSAIKIQSDDLNVSSEQYIQNATETSTQTYRINVTLFDSRITNLNVSLFYNGTNYGYDSQTNISLTNYTITKSLTLLVINPIYENHAFHWNISYTLLGNNYTEWSNEHNQTVYKYVMGFCNSNSTVNLTVPYLNFTFKDEVSGVNINATIASSVWNYWINGSDSTVNKTFSFSNVTHNLNYGFCVSPNWTQITAFAAIQYASSEAISYPQRIFKGAFDINNITTNKTLYLLASSSGIYSTYQVLTTARQTIEGVHIKVEETLDGGVSWVYITEGDTDSSGAITFWLNPNNQHRLTVSKSGFTTLVLTLYPTNTLYTITMGNNAGQNLQYRSYLAGVIYSHSPLSGTISPKLYNFTYYLYSNIYPVQNCTMGIYLPNGTIIGNATGCNSTGGTIAVYNLNISSYDRIYGYYTVTVNNSFIILESDASWINVHWLGEEDSGIAFTLRGAIKDLTNSTELWGTNTATQDFNRLVFFFLFFAIILAALNLASGYDTAYPGAIIYILAIVIFIGTIANGVSGPGYFYLDGATRIGCNAIQNSTNPSGPMIINNCGTMNHVFNNWLICIHVALLAAIYSFTTAKRYQS